MSPAGVVSAAKGTSTRASINLRLICMPSSCLRADGARAWCQFDVTGWDRSFEVAVGCSLLSGHRKPQTASAPHQPSPIPDVGPRSTLCV